MIEKTFYVVGPDRDVVDCMNDLGYKQVGRSEANFICFTGGADINPAIYHMSMHPDTHFNRDRDIFEVNTYDQLKNTQIKVGICRGGQLLNALNGGILYQHVTGHGGREHGVTYQDEHGELHKYIVNSIHHQMMIPNRDAEIWGTTRVSETRELSIKSTVRVRAGDHPDYEVLWYPKTRSLCFQAHPEYDAKKTRPFFNVCLDRVVHELTKAPV